MRMTITRYSNDDSVYDIVTYDDCDDVEVYDLDNEELVMTETEIEDIVNNWFCEYVMTENV